MKPPTPTVISFIAEQVEYIKNNPYDDSEDDLKEIGKAIKEYVNSMYDENDKITKNNKK